MYNIRREGSKELLLGCSVQLPEHAMQWLKNYQGNYPQFKFYIVETNDPGDMVQSPQNTKVTYSLWNYPL